MPKLLVGMLGLQLVVLSGQFYKLEEVCLGEVWEPRLVRATFLSLLLIPVHNKVKKHLSHHPSWHDILPTSWVKEAD